MSHLGEDKKGTKKREDPKRKNNNNKPSVDFKPVQQVLLVLLDATGRGGLGFAFLPSYGFERMGTRSEQQYLQFPSLQPRSSLSCPAQISHSAAHSVSHMVLHHSVSQSQVRGSNQPLGVQPEKSCGEQLKSPSGCASSFWRVPYKAAARSSQQAHGFSHSPTLQLIRRLPESGSDMAQLLPSPGVTQDPSFSGASIHSPSGCIPPLCVSHFISIPPGDFKHSSWCQAAHPALVGEGAGDLTLLPIS